MGCWGHLRLPPKRDSIAHVSFNFAKLFWTATSGNNWFVFLQIRAVIFYLTPLNPKLIQNIALNWFRDHHAYLHKFLLIRDGQIVPWILAKPHLSLNIQCISESCVEIKIKLNFYFHTSLWCLKKVYESLMI